MLATGYIAYVIAERQTSLQTFLRYNDSWAISQMLSEYLRLEERLAAFALGAEGADRDEVQLRLDIIFSRLEAMEQGTLQDFIERNPEHSQLISDLSNLLTKIDSQFDELDAEKIKALLPEMNSFDKPLTALASSSVTYDVSVIRSSSGAPRPPFRVRQDRPHRFRQSASRPWR